MGARLLPPRLRPPGPRVAQRFPQAQRYVIASADEKIVDLAVSRCTWAQAREISICMSVFDLLGNPYPATGTIELLRYTPKKFLQAATEAGLNNEQASVGIGAAEAAP